MTQTCKKSSRSVSVRGGVWIGGVTIIANGKLPMREFQIKNKKNTHTVCIHKCTIMTFLNTNLHIYLIIKVQYNKMLPQSQGEKRKIYNYDLGMH